MIEEQQHEYDKARRAIRRREEKRLANIEEQEHAEDNEDNEDEANTTRQFVGQESEQSESFDDEDVNSEDDIQIVDDDDYSIPSTSSVTSVSPISGARCSSRSLFASALSSLPPHREED
jgi:predicted membrane protein